jgi:capsular polysaccharide biosynthesis protein
VTSTYDPNMPTRDASAQAAPAEGDDLRDDTHSRSDEAATPATSGTDAQAAAAVTTPPATARSLPPKGRVGSPPSGERVRPRRLRRRTVALLLTLPLLGGLLFGAGTAIYLDAQAPSYTAQSLVSVLPTEETGEVSTAFTDIWVQIGNSDPVVDAAATRIGTEPATLRDQLQVAQAGSAALVSVSVTTPDATRSADWANEVADELVAQASPTVVPGYTLRQVTTAVPPSTSTGPSTPLLVLGAVVVGLIAGTALAQALGRRLRRRAGAVVR